MKFKITGKNIEELLKEYGSGSAGFYPQEWYKSEKFFTEKPEAGEYEIDFENTLTNLTFEEQINKLKKGFDFPHPAVIAEAVLSHYKKTGERLLENIYSRTNALDSDGVRVFLGSFGAEGLVVDDNWGAYRFDDLGVSASRKLRNLKAGELETSEPLNLSLESAIKLVKENGMKIYKEI